VAVRETTANKPNKTYETNGGNVQYCRADSQNRDKIQAVVQTAVNGVVSLLAGDYAAIITEADIIIDGGRTAVLQDDTLLNN